MSQCCEDKEEWIINQAIERILKDDKETAIWLLMKLAESLQIPPD